MTETLVIELSEELKREIERAARAKGVSAAEFIAAAAAEKAGAIETAAAYFALRAARARPGAFARVFGHDRLGGIEPPGPGDELSTKI